MPQDDAKKRIGRVEKKSLTTPLAMFGTAVAGGLGLFFFYNTDIHPTIRMARARIFAQGALIAALAGGGLYSYATKIRDDEWDATS